jgi:hypothetical protein
MRKKAEKKPRAASPDHTTAAAPPKGDAEDRSKSILPPPDPELDGTQKRGFGVFKRGPGAV